MKGIGGEGRVGGGLSAFPRPARRRRPEVLPRIAVAILIGWIAVGAVGCDRSGPATGARNDAAGIRPSADAEPGDSRQRFWQSFRAASEARRGGDRLAAIAGYREALQQDPEHADSLYYLAQLRYARGDVAAARSHLEKLVTVEPRALRGWQQLAALDSTPLPGWMPDLEAAAAAQRRAQDLNPGESRNHALRARIAAYLGETARAREAAVTALGYNPNHAGARRILLWLALRDSGPGGPSTVGEESAPCGGNAGCRDLPGVVLMQAALQARGTAAGRATDPAGGAWPPLVAPASPHLGIAGASGAGGAGSTRGLGAESDGDAEVVDLDGDGDGDMTVELPEAPGRARIRGWRRDDVGGGAATRSMARAWSSRRDGTEDPAGRDAGGIRPIPWRAALLRDPAGPVLLVVGGGERPVRTYRRRQALWREATVRGLPADVRGAVATVADFDGDGLTDVFLANLPVEAMAEGGGEGLLGSDSDDRRVGSADLRGRVFRARADGGYEATSIVVPGPLAAAVAGDVDGDGDVDLLVGRDPGPEASAAGHLLRRLEAGEENGAADSTPLSVVLWRNEDGRLRPDPEGVPPARCTVRDFVLLDFDADGGLDVFLATGGLAPDRIEPDRLWRYRDGRFRDASPLLGSIRFDVTPEAASAANGTIELLRGGLVPGDPARRVEIVGRRGPGPRRGQAGQNSNE